MLEIIEIDIKEFENKIFKEYQKLFPEEEQRSLKNLKKAYEQGIEKFYKITLDKTIIGFFMLEKIKGNYPYYIDYFAIFEEYQKKGYGTKALEKVLLEIIKDEGLCIEIEKEEKDNLITIKRANFYKRIGFKKVDSEYLLFNVLYTPYIYTKKENIEKNEIDKIMFDYYKMNCGEEALKKYCKIIK